MTREEEEAIWARAFRETPEEDVQAELRAQTRFNILVCVLILLALVSLIHGLVQIGAAGLGILQQGVTL